VYTAVNKAGSIGGHGCRLYNRSSSIPLVPVAMATWTISLLVIDGALVVAAHNTNTTLGPNMN
jgi:hypothetical protein